MKLVRYAFSSSDRSVPISESEADWREGNDLPETSEAHLDRVWPYADGIDEDTIELKRQSRK